MEDNTSMQQKPKNPFVKVVLKLMIKQIEKKAVDIFKSIVTPYVAMLSIKQSEVQSLLNSRKAIKEKNESKGTSGTKLSYKANSGREWDHIERLEIQSVGIPKRTVPLPKNYPYSTSSTAYTLESNEVLLYTTESLKLLESTKINGLLLSELKTFDDIWKYTKGLGKYAQGEFELFGTGIVNDVKGAYKHTLMIPKTALTQLEGYWSSFKTCYDGAIEVGLVLADIGVLVFRYTKYIVTTIVSITSHSIKMSTNPFTSSNVPTYVALEIGKFVLELKKMQLQGNALAEKFMSSLTKLVAPATMVLDILKVFRSPVGGLVLSVVFKDKAEDIGEVVGRMKQIVTLILKAKKSVETIAREALGTMGIGVASIDISYDEATYEYNSTTNAITEITPKMPEGTMNKIDLCKEQSKKSIDQYKATYLDPLDAILDRYDKLMTLLKSNKAYSRVEYVAANAIANNFNEFSKLHEYEKVEMALPQSTSSKSRNELMAEINKDIDAANEMYTRHEEEYKRLEQAHEDTVNSVASLTDGSDPSSDIIKSADGYEIEEVVVVANKPKK